MPARLLALKRALESMGLEVLKPGSGSHWKAVRPGKGGKTFPIPAHNGEKTEIGDQYIRAVCRCFEIDPEDLPLPLPGQINFNVGVSVTMAELATLKPESITAFFGGIAAVMKVQAEIEAAKK